MLEFVINCLVAGVVFALVGVVLYYFFKKMLECEQLENSFYDPIIDSLDWKNYQKEMKYEFMRIFDGGKYALFKKDAHATPIKKTRIERDEELKDLEIARQRANDKFWGLE